MVAWLSMSVAQNNPAFKRVTILKQIQAHEKGLSSSEVEIRRRTAGWNELPERKVPIFRKFVAQFNNIMVYILLAAVVISLIIPFLNNKNVGRGDFVNAVVILAIILADAALGFFQEMKTENAIALLKRLSSPNSKVRRQGKVMIIPSRELVPGDLVLLETGDSVTADGRVVSSASLEVDEATLTGESVPVSKKADEKPNPDFGSPGMVYAGTMVTRGFCEYVVTGTGLSTEVGKITAMMMSLEPPPTPLQLQLKRAGKNIALLVLALCVGIFLLGIIRGIPMIEMFFTAVTLAVAAVPEGLPAIVTICLALGVQRMIKKHALIRRLDAVETLGNVTVICADKTGTITENKMQVQNIWVPSGGSEQTALEIAASCNRAELPDIGDPTEVALLKAAESKGLKRLEIEDEEVPFTSEAKYMVTIHMKGAEKVRFLKGAPEVIARLCTQGERETLLKISARYSAEGFRVLAVAEGDPGAVVSRGLIAMIDPPRKGIEDSIKEAKRAGVRTIMITGDHPATALAVASAAGLRTERVIVGDELGQMNLPELKKVLEYTSVFARVQPSHKVKILLALQELGEIVAMSGDGINDAPALKMAHVGIAMGLKGTDVAREAASMVLTDDDYTTIVAAIKEGRRIYDNIKKFVIFLMRSNLGEVAIVALAIFAGMPLPLLPLHILWINLVTDSFPALALAAEEGEHDIMGHPPREQSEGIFYGEWSLMLLAASLNSAISLGLFVYLLRTSADLVMTRTVVLTATIVFQLFLAVSAHSKRNVLTEPMLKNKWLIRGIALSILFHLVLLYTPLGNLFSVVPLSLKNWLLILAVNILGFLFFEAGKWWKEKQFV